ncbi:Late competence protein ComGA, access of DNA to ComEA [Pediococcus damnosus]|uniref:Late competence protein ComGA, access of DNA to ComEA n=1 Tax=Pediococcus damnosus TaxID=51663 RepID=A0A0R2H4R1_9LACO|nr:competence type IV pilus ATPase ComGA [Pediococcus damnosus]AMV61813.1 Late competence protein ComGA, access of DNA to ComEA [Pediococcus damnosus]AMV66314.1 Late competence protein ComGA, access of DNA to ComEA [Pediococcus damnosus]AMV69984.1 Late competence protein ComGA, access of DNA to ComEA [Pediococcus damnosus]KJU73329.1 secretion protein E [Pediococcus damnosus LMG 28219]KRN47761.1 type II IV secretion system protein [Pediococcus damnosus]
MKLEEYVQKFVKTCIQERATDLYMLPRLDEYQIMYKRLNHCHIIQEVSQQVGEQLIAYFKFQADMALSERRRPQTGAYYWQQQGSVVHLRLSSVGDFLNRESMVIRFIYPVEDAHIQHLEPFQWEKLVGLANKRGLLLFSGPMGSGKTTSIYQLARYLAQEKVVMTIEDPVEIFEEKFLQLQVNTRAEMTYEQLLKVGLRHRPDVFIIGEIRDDHTANVAVKAALSGHLVLSTVHAQNSFGVIRRLQQFNIDTEMLQQALTGIAYQRLIPVKKGEVAALFDIMDGEELQNAFHKMPNQKMNVRWGECLEKEYQKHNISEKTLLEYQEG